MAGERLAPDQMAGVRKQPVIRRPLGERVPDLQVCPRNGRSGFKKRRSVSSDGMKVARLAAWIAGHLPSHRRHRRARANLFDLLRVDGRRGGAPRVADVGQNRGDLIVAQLPRE
jgi:hypothetical protein